MAHFRVVVRSRRGAGELKQLEITAVSEEVARRDIGARYVDYDVVAVHRDPFLADLLHWLDDLVGPDVADIAVNATLISRGVDFVFSLPRFRSASALKEPVKMLLQAGFAREYRHRTWKQILIGQAHGHVVSHFQGIPLASLPEVQAAIVSVLQEMERHGASDGSRPHY